MSFYSNKQHFAYADVMWKPVNRVTASLGYPEPLPEATHCSESAKCWGGTWLQLSENFRALTIDLFQSLSYKTTWNYYGYNLRHPRFAGLQPSVRRLQRQ